MILLALCAGLTCVSSPSISAQTDTIWPSSTTPQRMDGDKSAVELGVRFRSDVAGTVTGIRFYKYSSNNGTHTGTLWTNTGTKLASATFTGESSSGWQQVTFASPVAIAANTTYVASYHTNAGRYGASDGYFATAGYDRAPLHALQNGIDGANGVYHYGAASAFPDQTYQSANYWVDVAFTPSDAAPPPPPPPSGGCPCSVWNGLTAPAADGDAADTNAVELGMRVQADASGYITALRFYKFADNSGTHVGSLWTNTGSLLARATFTGESAAGWQQVSLAAPVAIEAHTTYVVSYHTDAGHYAASSGYFATGVDNAPLHALRDGVDGPNGVYHYGSTSSFPDETYQSANYWTDVVFATTLGPDLTPPTVSSVTPASGATNVAATTVVTATFSEMIASSTLNPTTFELRDPAGAVVPASAYAGGETPTASLIPVSPLANSSTYTATVKGGATGVKDLAGNALASDYSWSFTTAPAAAPPPPAGCPCTIWSASTTPAIGDSDANAIEVGVRFRSDTSGYVTGLRFYKVVANTGIHVGNLWTSTGLLVARATFAGESAAGWQQVNLATPVAIAANTTYVVSYHTDTGHYAADTGYFASGVDNAPLHALRDGVDGPNGVYRYGTASAFPSDTYHATNYWVDVVFDNALGPDTTPPTVYAVTPPAGATGIAATSVVTATFSEMMAAATVNTTTFVLRDPAGTLIPAWVTAGGETPTATLTPSSALAFATTYTATVKGGSGGVKDLAGNALASDYSWSFTTVAAPPPAGTCPCSIWNDAVAPAGPESDGNAVELGVKFQSAVSGYITALRFHKFQSNTGTHIGGLWTRDGTRLATVIFSNETALGWQQVTISPPVSIAANTTYIASYHTDVGYYAASGAYFAAAFTNSPLRALADGADGGNGVYRYGPSSFPDQTYHSANYWVDVVFATSPPDTTPPIVTAVTPGVGSSGVPGNTVVAAVFSEPMAAATLNSTTFLLRDPSGVLVPGTVTYDAATRTATLDPLSDLAPATTYTAIVNGGTTDPRVTDLAGNALAMNATWLFTTAAAPPGPGDGPGGPILVVSSTTNPYSRYYAEILRSEGLNAFAVADISTVSAATLAAYDVVILGEMPLTTVQVATFTDWVVGGGNLISMRPDKKLATLLGLVDQSSTLANGYLLVNGSTAPGAGIVAETMQFHGTADRYLPATATSVATLYSGRFSPTANPGVTLNLFGVLGGKAAAFTYDLARSIVYTRQGNPAWAGQDRDGVAPITADDLFFGASSTDPRPDWLDLDKVAIPQADEQQRLLANLLLHMSRDRKPLPRFWYFPRGIKAVVVMTGDEHGVGGEAGRFDAYRAASPAGCSVANWECVRGTAYVFTDTPLSDASAAAYAGEGFEIALHVNTGCANWTPSSLQTFYTNQLNMFAATFPSLPSPTTHRVHCSVWSDYATQPQVELGYGIRLDTNYYYWPDKWVMDRPGFFTGSGMPMRFVDTDGALVDVYQAATQMTDQSGQSYPFTVDTLLDKALGPEGYYGAFTANMHADSVYSFGSDQIVASAQARGVPVVAARQLLEWLDGRNGSTFRALVWNGTTLTFSIDVGVGAGGLLAMLPSGAAGGTLTTLTVNGSPVAFTRQTIKGVEYAIFQAAAGAYQATYAP